MTYTLVSFHAHPDDESLLTGGTLAQAAADGHRVVLVTATDGEAGLAPTAGRQEPEDLAVRRAQELDRAARALRCHRVVRLGYPDSGMQGEHPDGFAFLPVHEAARRLAAVLDEEHADVLTVYDAVGGYGHPDHVQVHRVGVCAAQLAIATPVVLEATVDRQLLLRALRLARLLGRVLRLSPELAPDRFRTAFTPRHLITHQVDVSGQAWAKRAAMAAHRSQASGSSIERTLALFLRLPRPVFRLVFGREWFVERGRAVAGRPVGDIFSALSRSQPVGRR